MFRFLRVVAELLFQAHDEVELLFALHHLRRGSPADGRLDQAVDVGDVQAIRAILARSMFTVRLGWPSSWTSVMSLIPRTPSSTRLIAWPFGSSVSRSSRRP
jgi:hypothetical protein